MIKVVIDMLRNIAIHKNESKVFHKIEMECLKFLKKHTLRQVEKKTGTLHLVQNELLVQIHELTRPDSQIQ